MLQEVSGRQQLPIWTCSSSSSSRLSEAGVLLAMGVCCQVTATAAVLAPLMVCSAVALAGE